MRLSRLHILSAAILPLLFTTEGCRSDVSWSRSVPVSPKGWNQAEVVEFNLDPAAYEPKPENRFAEMTARAVGDTLERWLGTYRAIISVRYLDNCNVSDLRLIAEKAGLDEPIATDTLRIPLFDSGGRPLGKGSLGISEAGISIYPFKVGNGTTLSLRPVEYADTLTGITDITLSLTPG